MKNHMLQTIGYCTSSVELKCNNFLEHLSMTFKVNFLKFSSSKPYQHYWLLVEYTYVVILIHAILYVSCHVFHIKYDAKLNESPSFCPLQHQPMWNITINLIRTINFCDTIVPFHSQHVIKGGGS